ncbi:MAG: metallopeptidase family protein [Eubacteriales bacterium]|nr:metallopeptidase family protein [Eubacteriales bacterium]
MYTFEECGEMFDEIADSYPYELYRELSGGMRIVPESKLHPKAVAKDLYILGEYHRTSIGKYIIFYYGSIVKIYGHLPREQFYEKLRGILSHELRHHNEYLAGCDDLILYDNRCIGDYLIRKGK